jgi:hypothetical protein
VRDNEIAKTLDGGVRSDRDVPEGPPVIGNQMPRPQAREKIQRVLTSEMPGAKRPSLPPGSVSDRQQRDIELSFPHPEDPLDQEVRGLAQPCVAGEEAAFALVLEKIHVRRCPPAVVAVTVAFVPRRGRMDMEVVHPDRVVGREGLHVREPSAMQPLRDHRRCIHGYFVG